jgi:signal transduction histidine kinase
MPTIVEFVKSRRDRFLLMFMLELLHLSIWLDFSNPLSRSLMLAHLGLFLIWQPVWRADEKLRWYNGLIFILLTLAFVSWLNPWLIYGWLILLIGFVGGRVLTDKHERTTYMVVLFFLVLELLLSATTQLVDITLKAHGTFEILHTILPLLILIIPPTIDEKRLQRVDILHAVMSSMFACLLSLGALLFMFISNTEYITALVQTSVAIGLFMLVISWLLTPRVGFSGLYQLWTHSLLNIGTPFEHWLSELSELAQKNNTANEFLEAAMDELVDMPWITGVKWQTPELNDTQGELTVHDTEMNFDDLTVTIYTRSPVGGALLLHCTLLVRLIYNYYIAKQREHELTKQTQLKTIYETGSRITHDIKNLLQSLHAITSILMYDRKEGEKSVSQKIIEKQLPSLTQRLQMAHDKLQAPQSELCNTVYLKDWWHDLKSRNNPPNTGFQADIKGNLVIPGELFDSVTDNLLENARSKSAIENDIEITVTLVGNDDLVSLTVCDTGSMIPDHIRRQLFREPLESNNGLGIGLYQAARQAEMMGYVLALKHNQQGRVCFELANLNVAI